MEKLDFNKLKPFLLRNPVIRQNLFIGLTFILMGDSLKDELPKGRKDLFKEVAKNIYNVDNILDMSNALTYHDYNIIDLMLKDLRESEDEEEKALYKVIEEKVENITYEDLALVDLVMYFMRFNEHNITLEAITRYYYMIEKYKDTPLAQEIRNIIQDIIDNKDHQAISMNYEALRKQYEGNDKELVKVLEDTNKQYSKAWIYLTLTSCLKQVALNGEYHIQEVKRRINLRYIERNYLEEYLIFCKDERDLQVLIRNTFENNLKTAKNYQKAREDLAKLVEEAEEKTKVKVNVSIDENNDITLKVVDVIEELNNIDTLASKYKYFDFNLLTDLLAYDEETKKFIKDDKETTKDYQYIDNVLNRVNKDKGVDKSKTFIDRKHEAQDESIVKRKPKKAPTLKQLREEYKDETTKTGDFDFNRKWALLDNTKLTTNVINMREQASNIVFNNKELTEREIKKIESELKDLQAKSKKKPLRAKEQKKLDDLSEKYNDLLDLLTRQEQQEHETKKKLADKKDDLELKYNQLTNAQEELNKARENEDKEAIKNMQDTFKSIEKEIKGLNKDISKMETDLTNRGTNWQLDLYNNMLVYEKNKRNNKGQKESYKLMVTQDYNILNLNLKEVTNFLLYIPNIPNIEQQLEEDYITLDLEHYVNFFNDGLTKVNTSRIRKDLLTGLIEARKESYDYSFYDSRGVLQEGSLILFGDVLTTEYKGKGTVKVQLGAKFKENIKKAFINGELVQIKREALTNSRTKVEANAKKLAIYFTRLARNEAKKGLKNGIYTKDLKIGTIIDYLVEINAINYDTSRYNQFIREPLEYALYMGRDNNYFSFETRAFKHYDKAIDTLNNGANAKDKIANFENEGITIYLNTGNVANLDKSEKAHNTFNDKVNEAKKRKQKAQDKALEKEISRQLKENKEVQDALKKVTKDITIKE